MAIDQGQLLYAMGLSVVLIAVIIILAAYIHWFGRGEAIKRAGSRPRAPEDFIIPPKHFILMRVLLDKDDHASLAAFQFLMWTLLISFLYIALWFMQFLNGIAAPPKAMDASLLELMGISVAVPLINKGIMDYKQFKSRPEGEVYREPVYASMLEENNRPSLLRFQMFLWTIASLVIYFWGFMTMVSGATTLGDLQIPKVDPNLLFLMGLSQVGYLGSKAYAGTVTTPEKKEPATPAAPGPKEPVTARSTLSIREIVPRSVKPDELVTLLGSGFGTKPDTLTVGNITVAKDTIRRWDDTRIEFPLPLSIDPGKVDLRVIAGGNTATDTITVTEHTWMKPGLDNILAEIIGQMWIDDPSQKGYRTPPTGYFITDKRYYFFFEFMVPAGTPPWGRTQFKAEFYINGKLVEKEGTKSFMPGYMNGMNYGVFDYTFTETGQFTVEIKGKNTIKMDIVVDKLKAV